MLGAQKGGCEYTIGIAGLVRTICYPKAASGEGGLERRAVLLWEPGKDDPGEGTSSFTFSKPFAEKIGERLDETRDSLGPRQSRAAELVLAQALMSRPAGDRVSFSSWEPWRPSGVPLRARSRLPACDS